MLVKLGMPVAGTISIEVEGEMYLIGTQDLVARTVTFEFPKPITIEADEPPLTGLITSFIPG